MVVQLDTYIECVTGTQAERQLLFITELALNVLSRSHLLLCLRLLLRVQPAAPLYSSGFPWRLVLVERS